MPHPQRREAGAAFSHACPAPATLLISQHFALHIYESHRCKIATSGLQNGWSEEDDISTMQSFLPWPLCDAGKSTQRNPCSFQWRLDFIYSQDNTSQTASFLVGRRTAVIHGNHGFCCISWPYLRWACQIKPAEPVCPLDRAQKLNTDAKQLLGEQEDTP